MSQRHVGVRRLALAGMMAALCAICSQIQIPLPMIPLNLALLAVFLAGALLGPKMGALSMLAYVLLGAAGLPVFAGFKAGPAALFGKTGGYILGYILCACLCGVLPRRLGFTFKGLCLSMLCGLAACYTLGTLWFMLLTHLPLSASLSYCVLPFLPGDAVKIVLAAFLSLRLRGPLASLC